MPTKADRKASHKNHEVPWVAAGLNQCAVPDGKAASKEPQAHCSKCHTGAHALLANTSNGTLNGGKCELLTDVLASKEAKQGASKSKEHRCSGSNLICVRQWLRTHVQLATALRLCHKCHRNFIDSLASR